MEESAVFYVVLAVFVSKMLHLLRFSNTGVEKERLFTALHCIVRNNVIYWESELELWKSEGFNVAGFYLKNALLSTRPMYTVWHIHI